MAYRRRDMTRFVFDWGDQGPMMEQRTMLVALAEELRSAGRERMAAMVEHAAAMMDEIDRDANAAKDEVAVPES